MNREPIKAIIFDMDGTMVNNMAVHNRIWMEYLTEIGAQVDPETFNDRTAGKTNPEIMRMFLGDGPTDEELFRLGLEKEIRYRKVYHGQVHPMPGLIEFLRVSRQRGMKMAVATSAPPDNVAFILGELGLRDFFDSVVNGEDITHSKPHPEIFLKAAERLEMAPVHCLVFEDARWGIEAARRAGMLTIAVTTGINIEEAREIPGVWKAIADFREFRLEEVIREEINGRSNPGQKS